jgi:hypothetical protein
MQFKLATPWAMIYEHGSSALRLLKIARDVEIEHAANTARLEAYAVGSDEFLALVARNESLAHDVFSMYSASVLTFEAMMEAALGDALRIDSRLVKATEGAAIEARWVLALELLKKDPAGYNEYHANIYKKFWMPLAHPAPGRLTGLDDLAVPLLLTGYANGWDAYTKLASGIGKPLDPDSWATLCQTHGL